MMQRLCSYLRLGTLSILSIAVVSAWTSTIYTARQQQSSSSYNTQRAVAVKTTSILVKSESRISRWKLFTNSFRSAPSSTWCTSLDCTKVNSQNDDVAVIVPSGDSTHNHQHSQLLNNNGEQYQLVPIPERSKVSTHAIHGTLFKESCIERYDVYRLLNGNPYNSSTNDKGAAITDWSNQPPDVVAIVSFGSDLDGHSSIVHGGILALIIDDVLGFGYYAILLQEYESRIGESRINGTTTRTFDLPLDVVAVTANLNINYRAPVQAGSTVVVEATLVSNDDPVERRREKNKFHWNVQVKSHDGTITHCQATSLYVIPKCQLLSK